jgi:hypothetical protein
VTCRRIFGPEITLGKWPHRDYLDVAALSHHIGLPKSAAALERMNELYAEFKDETGDLLTAVAVKLSLPDPYDLTDIDLSEYKGIDALDTCDLGPARLSHRVPPAAPRPEKSKARSRAP